MLPRRYVFPLVLATGLSVAMFACGGGSSTPTAPTPPPPQCQTENYGTLQLSDTSAHTTQTVFVNGVNEGTINPGQYLDVHLSAGVSVSVAWYVTNTNLLACQPIAVTPIQCQTSAYTCAYP